MRAPRPQVTHWTLEEKSEIQFESSCRSSESKEFDGVCLRPSFLLLILYDSEKSRSPAGRRRDTSHVTQLNAPIRPAETNLMWHHARKLNMKWDHRTTFWFLMRFSQSPPHLSLFGWMWLQKNSFPSFRSIFLFFCDFIKPDLKTTN